MTTKHCPYAAGLRFRLVRAVQFFVSCELDCRPSLARLFFGHACSHSELNPHITVNTVSQFSLVHYHLHSKGDIPGCLQIQPNKFPGDFQDTFNKVPGGFLQHEIQTHALSVVYGIMNKTEQKMVKNSFSGLKM